MSLHRVSTRLEQIGRSKTSTSISSSRRRRGESQGAPEQATLAARYRFNHGSCAYALPARPPRKLTTFVQQASVRARLLRLRVAAPQPTPRGIRVQQSLGSSGRQEVVSLERDFAGLPTRIWLFLDTILNKGCGFPLPFL
jgi:hypothetical protein